MNTLPMKSFHKNVRDSFELARDKPLIVTVYGKETYVVIPFDCFMCSLDGDKSCFDKTSGEK